MQEMLWTHTSNIFREVVKGAIEDVQGLIISYYRLIFDIVPVGLIFFNQKHIWFSRTSSFSNVAKI
jgi:hypothetical protein